MIQPSLTRPRLPHSDPKDPRERLLDSALEPLSAVAPTSVTPASAAPTSAAPFLAASVLAALLLGASLAGCSDDKTTEPDPEPSPYLPATSPGNVLDNLQIAMELRDAVGFEALLFAPEFRFVVDPVDLRDQPDLPRHWGYDCEADLIERMLDSPSVLDLTLRFVKGEVEDARSEDGPGDPSWKRSMITDVEFELETVNPDDPTDNIIYKVNGDRAIFLFAQDPTELAGGEPSWKITEWRDVRIGASPSGSGARAASLTMERSFGEIKSIYSSPGMCGTLQPTNPRFALENFQDAYDERDLVQFTEVFADDGYEFRFDATDAADSDIPEAWGWEEERSAHAELFASPRVDVMSLDFRRGFVTTPSAEEGFPLSVTRVIEADNVQLRAGDLSFPALEFAVDGTIATFGFAPDVTESAFGYPLWKIVSWSDQQNAPISTISTSWGRFKHSFYLPPAPYESPSSPEAVIRNFRNAYERRDLEAYEACLDLVEFAFRFDPVDVQDQPDLPVFWGATQELAVTRNLFHSGAVFDIALSYVPGVVRDVDESDGGQIDLSWKKMTVTDVQLDVTVGNPSDPTDDVIYRVSGDRALFFFSLDESGSEPVWRLAEWRDIRIGGTPLTVLQMSWGEVKSRFR